MIPRIFVSDALGLLGLYESALPSTRTSVLDKMTDCLERGELRFPREVVDELRIIDRGGHLAAWSSGLGRTKDLWPSDIMYQRDVMKVVVQLGYDEGFQTLDDSEPIVSPVSRLCFGLAAGGTAFHVVTTDTGTHPLVPTMEQFSNAAGWSILNPEKCARELDLY